MTEARIADAADTMTSWIERWAFVSGTGPVATSPRLLSLAVKFA